MRSLVCLAVVCLPALLTAQLDVNFTRMNVSCFGQCNGWVAATASGGVAPYIFQWSNGISNDTITGLCAGVYTVTVTDASQNLTVDSVTITQPFLPLSVTIGTTVQICDIAPDGSAFAAPEGGTPPYSYLWSNGMTVDSIIGLAEGVYTVTVTDINGCTASGQDTVFFWPEGIWLMIIPTPITCFGENNGIVHISAMTGTPPYSYLWSTGDSMTEDIFNLSPGIYTVTVTDANGCSNTASAAITEPPPLDVNLTATPAFCGIPGSATVIPSGGTPPYSVLWSKDSLTTFTISAPAGQVSVTVTDANDCTFVAGLGIPGNNDTLTITGHILQNAGCLIGGSASLDVSGGSGNYSYLWNTPSADTTATVANVPAGTYTVTVTDNTTACTGTTTLIVPPTKELTVTAGITTSATCIAGATVSVTVSGGTPPFNYIWSNDSTNATLTGLTPGIYTVMVKDSTGCTAADTIEVLAPPLPNVAAQMDTLANCIGGGAATATPSGGTSPYTFAWSGLTITTASITNQPAGTYTVTVTDAKSCTATGSVTIGQAPSPTVTTQADSLANCIGGGGKATATPAGGTAPYTFAWSGLTITTASITNQPAGAYTVTVTDANKCTATGSVVIGQAPSPTVTGQMTSPANCLGGGGAATAIPAGGTAPYTFAWSGLTITTASIANQPAGTYTVTVTDANSCTGTGSVTISQTPSPTVTIIASTNVTCTTLGSATAEATGGTAPYSYNWGAAGTGATVINLAVGTYTVTATDANGCTGTASVEITLTSGGSALGDFVWFDNDQDGFQHPIETGVPNIAVALIQAGPDNQFGTADDITVATTTTNAAGKYQFACASAGTYVIKYSGLPAGYEFTAKDKVNNDCKDSDAKANGLTDPFTLLPGQGDYLCVDAGIHVLCDNVTNAGIICCNQTICEGDTPTLLNEVQPPTGGSGPIEFVWMQLITMGPGLPTWVAIPGANQATYQPGALFTTTSFMRCARRQGCISFLESNIVKVTVLPAGSPGCDDFAGNFNVSALNASTVMVKWTTEPEMIRYVYTVERSADKNTWTGIEEMMGYQDHTAPNHYNTMDHTPFEGMNYYRIRRTSAGGAQSLSEVREVEMKVSMDHSLAVYPNPVSQLLYIRNLMIYDTDARVELFTASGAWLHTLEIRAGTQQSFELPVGHLPQGIYLVRLRVGNGNVTTLKISKM